MARRKGEGETAGIYGAVGEERGDNLWIVGEEGGGDKYLSC